MEHRETVKVYNFRVFDPDRKQWRVSRHKATRDAIAHRIGEELIVGTEHEVASHELDGQGLYRRVATGWGELS